MPPVASSAEPSLVGAGSFLGMYVAAVNGPILMIAAYPVAAVSVGCTRRVSIASSNAVPPTPTVSDSINSVFAQIAANAVQKSVLKFAGMLGSVPAALLGATPAQWTTPILTAQSGVVITGAWPIAVDSGLILIEDFAPLGQ